MATVWIDPPYAAVTTVNGANDYVLRPPASGMVSRWQLSFENDGTFSGSVTIKARESGTGNTLRAVPYTDLYLNGAAGANSSATTTAITTTSIIEVPSDGLDVAFSVTSYTSGSGSLLVKALLG